MPPRSPCRIRASADSIGGLRPCHPDRRRSCPGPPTRLLRPPPLRARRRGRSRRRSLSSRYLSASKTPLEPPGVQRLRDEIQDLPPGQIQSPAAGVAKLSAICERGGKGKGDGRKVRIGTPAVGETCRVQHLASSMDSVDD